MRVRPMEHSADTAQRDANPATGALSDLRPDAPEQGFDLIPAKIGWRRFREDPRQGPPMAAIHHITNGYRLSLVQ